MRLLKRSVLYYALPPGQAPPDIMDVLLQVRSMLMLLLHVLQTALLRTYLQLFVQQTSFKPHAGAAPLGARFQLQYSKMHIQDSN